MSVTEPVPLRVLMVEDAEEEADLLAHELTRSGYVLTFERVDTAAAMRAALERQAWDVITSDHAMPAFSAPAALALAKALAPETPFIIVSGEIDLNLAVSLLKAGAHDYIQKRELVRVPPAIDREMREMEQRRQRRQAEEERRVSEEKFLKAFQNSPDAINVTRLSDGVYLAVNEGAERFSGYTAAEFIGQSTLTLNIWADPNDRARLAAELLKKGAFDNVEALCRRKDGVVVPVLMAARLITIDGEQCVITFTRDIRLQRQAEETLRRHNRELQAINQITAAVTTRLDQAALLDEALRGALNLTGLESGAVYLLDFDQKKLSLAATHNYSPAFPGSQLASPLPLDQEPCSQAALAGVASFQSDPAVPPGTRGPFQATFPLALQNTVTGVMSLWAEHVPPVPADTLELVQHLCGTVALALENVRLYNTVQRHADELEGHVAERTTQLSAINEELEAFSFTVAHDLRAPLRAIDGYSQILLAEHTAQLDRVGQAHVARIAANIQNLQQMLETLLALSRITQSPLKREPVDLSAEARAIAKNLQQREPQRRVAWRIADGLAARGDRLLLRTVLENLLSNAWKFTASQPGALIELDRLPASTPPGDTIYYVRDNGAGFNMAQADQLFQIFRRLHTSSEFPGTGVGLASVKRIVRRHGGRIWAEGAPGRGATLYFTLE